MSLYEKWQDLIGNQTDDTFAEFWEKYSLTEKNIYSDILDNPKSTFKGTFQELVDKYNADPVIFMGFLDGISTSLNTEIDFQSYDESSEIELNINFETLFYNMLAAEADYLYNLPQWEDVLPRETLEEIIKTFKKSKTLIKDKEPGRNDPCSCGSGKKYKKCCGAN